MGKREERDGSARIAARGSSPGMCGTPEPSSRPHGTQQPPVSPRAYTAGCGLRASLRAIPRAKSNCSTEKILTVGSFFSLHTLRTYTLTTILQSKRLDAKPLVLPPKAWVRGRIPVKVSSGRKPEICEKRAQNGRLRRLLARVWGVIALSDADFPAAVALCSQPQGCTPGPRCARPRRRVLQPFPRRRKRQFSGRGPPAEMLRWRTSAAA